ncbi:MAG: hypothetical protein GY839_07450 [candidate division Zixibacteria bacterium]|nr:hypothetical protein [candidate division Zixibacteria bacterium]
MISLNIMKYIRFISKIFKIRGEIKHKSDMGFFQLGRELYEFLTLNKMEPDEYYLYHLYKPEFSREDKMRFLSRNQYYLIESRLNPRNEVGILNKFVFNCYARSVGLPVPEMHGVFDPHSGFTSDGERLQTAEDLEKLFIDNPSISYIIKPTGSSQGKAIIKCKAADDGYVHIFRHGDIAIEEFYNRLCDNLINDPDLKNDVYIIEKTIKQHPFLDNYCDTSAQTIRILTFKTSSKEIEILARHLKLARKGSYIDNIALSGLGAGVDENGVLDYARLITEDDIVLYENHPDTGYPVKGVTIPYFSEVIELAKKAQSRMLHLRLVGWDILITENGPVIVEGNYGSDHDSIQLVSGRGFNTGNFAKELEKLFNKTDSIK